MEEVGGKVENKLKDQIDKDVYDAYTNPKIYQRTYELRNSVTCSEAKEKLSEDEVHVLEATVDLYNSYVDLQLEYQNHGDEVFKDSNFKQLKNEFENNLKSIKSKLK